MKVLNIILILMVLYVTVDATISFHQDRCRWQCDVMDCDYYYERCEYDCYEVCFPFPYLRSALNQESSPKTKPVKGSEHSGDVAIYPVIRQDSHSKMADARGTATGKSMKMILNHSKLSLLRGAMSHLRQPENFAITQNCLNGEPRDV